MRNITRHVARCAGYEFEDVVAQCDNVDIMAPSGAVERSRLARYARSLVSDSPRIEGKLIVGKPYDLFFAFCHSPRDLRYLKLIEGRRKECQRSICVLSEFWPSSIPDVGRNLDVLRGFDCIFSNLESSVDAIRELTGRPCEFMPLGVDALRFCPFPSMPPRHIDICNIGRRYEGLHRVLLQQADAGEMLYIYDTAGNFSVLDVVEHRRFLANLVRRSRFFIAFPPKFDRPDETGGLAEIGSRVFEGVAGGAVILGSPSRCSAFDGCFDWPDAVIPAAADGGDILDVIAELEADPLRVEQIRRNGIVGTLQRHDWLYRWREVLEKAGLRTTRLMVEREKRLNRMAADITANGTVRKVLQGPRRSIRF
jgi:hypothetical protein